MSSKLKTNFSSLLLEHTETFSKNTQRMMETMFDKKFSNESTVTVSEGLNTDKEFIVSILFTGMIYGEYILVTNEETAANVVGQTLNNKSGEELIRARKEIAEQFCDLLNMVVGQSVVPLTDVYQKLTITAPRVYRGTMSCANVLTGKSSLSFPQGTLDCYLYIDNMELDIASSYKEALSNVTAAYQDLQAAMKKLELQQTLLVQSEKMAALGTMAAGVAHEINTPLSTVSVVGGSLKDMIQDNEFDREFFISSLEQIEKTIARISIITNSMRDFACAIRKGAPEKVSVDELIQGVLIVLEERMKQENIHFSKNVAKGLTVECQVADITQVLLNLIDNSCDALESFSDKWIHVEVFEEDGEVIFKVCDAGNGIPRNLQDKIFDPFFTTKDIGMGSGLGLSIAKGVVEAHSGSIEVDENDPNTCFVLSLPKQSLIKKTSSH